MTSDLHSAITTQRFVETRKREKFNRKILTSWIDKRATFGDGGCDSPGQIPSNLPKKRTTPSALSKKKKNRDRNERDVSLVFQNREIFVLFFSRRTPVDTTERASLATGIARSNRRHVHGRIAFRRSRDRAVSRSRQKVGPVSGPP